MDALFARKEPHVKRIFERLAEIARACGPVRIYAQKTRVVMQVRIRFAGGHPQKRCFIAGFLLPPDVESSRIEKREEYGSRSYVGCRVRLERERDVDREIRGFMKLAYRIGCQDHLRK
jgi:hypothetical protein